MVDNSSLTYDELKSRLAAAEEAREAAEAETRRVAAIVKAETQREINQKDSGEYWDTIDNIWDFVAADYGGCYSAALNLRQQNECELYAREDVVLVFSNGEDLEVILTKNPDISSLFTKDVDTISQISQVGSIDRSNRTEEKKHEKKHAKNILGESFSKSDKSRAHTFPADYECYKFWWPMFKLVTGEKDRDYDKVFIQKLANMRTSKLCFAGEHNLIYDTPRDGVVCALPIFESMQDMAEWQYGTGYKMLITADSAGTYRELRMAQDSRYDHITIADDDYGGFACYQLG
uniref:Uncharacterized protein n=1 Tax=Entomoneis paludosa TaxID=265537 RepID=A0A7S2YQC2_9STRA|mmetsp:Transcript_5805/g.12229  ORF Transcript_5805/g.12229 Transcript_5805/m.12229 type:complete len:290 (+) Transcript_5805:238-1107(+)